MENSFWLQEFWLIARLFLALILGGVLGMERTLAGKTAGLRTYGLVSMGSALLVITSQLVTDYYFSIGVRAFDPLRVASQIVVGVGFLGTGLIIFLEREHRLSGLTTAAGLWVSAGIGMAVGFQLYGLAIGATALTLFTFTVLWLFEEFFDRRMKRDKK